MPSSEPPITPTPRSSAPIQAPISTTSSTSKSIPFWNVNIPPDEWTEECPEWLLGKDERDRAVLSTRDEDYVRQDWTRVKELVATNRIDLYERVPSDLRRYLHYIHDLKLQHGSVLHFIQHHRLRWDDVTPSGDPPFTNPSDYKVVVNDWPYGLTDDITHMVVWTKFLLEDDPETEELTETCRREIEDFVTRTFCGGGGVKREELVWFKNWARLKSVHAIEHFQVMVHNASREFLEKLTR